MMNETKIKGFGSFTPQQFALLSEQLALSMSQRKLSYCAKYYKNAERRDPFADELQMLSALSLALEELPEADCIHEFTTEDPNVAQTYRDMLQKRGVLHSDASYPMTLAEAASIATEELARVGVTTNCRAAVTAHRTEDLLFDPFPAACEIEGSDVRLYPTPEAITPGDVVVLVTSSDQSTSNDSPPVPIKSSYRIGKEGILFPLLRHFDSLTVNLRAFSTPTAPAPLTVLTDSTYCGAYVLTVSRERLREFLACLEENEFCAFPIAYVASTKHFTFLRNDGTPLSIQTGFLRSLYERKKRTLHLSANGGESAQIHRIPVSPNTCQYIASPLRGCREETVAAASTVMATATAHPASDRFRAGLYSTLLPAITLAAHGIPLTEQSLSVSLAYSSREAALETLLGIYRAEAELPLPAHEVRLSPEASTSLTVFSVAKGTACPSLLSTPGAYVYYLSVAEGDDLCRDLAAVREQLSELALLHAGDAVLSARVVFCQTPLQALEEMKGRFSYHPIREEIDLQKTVSISVLIESEAHLTLPIVAHTCAEESAEASPQIKIPSPAQSLIPAECPQITLLSTASDSNARTLATVLRERGAHVRCFTDTEGDSCALIRSILTSHALIVCRGAHLAQSPQSTFALETLCRAGGTLIAMEAVEDPAYLSFPDGIPEEILEALTTPFQKNEKNHKKI